MPVPDFQSIMLPALNYFSDGKAHTNQEIRDFVRREFQLSELEVAEKLTSGKQTKLANRVAWALVYLTAAKLLAQHGRGVRIITNRGTDLLGEDLNKIDIGLLFKYPEFAEFRSKKSKVAPSPNEQPPKEDSTTPDERLDEAFDAAQDPNSQEILDAILANTPEFFERLVLDVLSGLGYGGTDDEAQSHLGKSGDGGVDGVIREDALGLELIYVQAKRYAVENTIGRPSIQQFAGSLDGFRARKGVFITTSSFSREAIQYAKDIEKRIALIDGEMLISLMIQANIGVRTVRTYELKALDQDYFTDS